MFLSKGIGRGVVIWVVMFAIASALAGYNAMNSSWSQVILILASAILAFLFSGFVRPKDVLQGFEYGFTWVVVGVILDLLITLRFSPNVMLSWQYWLGYALVLVIPILRSVIKKTVAPAV
jgi:hypothetical protein